MTTVTGTPARLLDGLREILALEAEVEGRASAALATCGHREAAGILSELVGQARDHAAAVGARLEAIGGAGGVASGTNGHTAYGGPRAVRTSHQLRRVYGALSEAVFAYATIQAVAHQLRDSWIIAASGTTAHLARQHTQEYLGAMGRIMQMLHDVAIEELEDEGLACQCICPACHLGLCLCGETARAILGEAWAAARPTSGNEGARIPTPRPGSAAEAAGFMAGDVVCTVGSMPAESVAAMQTALKDHEPGSPIRIRVKRGGEAITLVARRPEPPTLPELRADEEDCLQPSGPVFYLDRARDLQRRIRVHAPEVATPGPDALGALSPRELQVLRLVADGATNPMIAEKLRIRRPTVARHIANILIKLGVTNRTEAAGIAVEHGLTAD